MIWIVGGTLALILIVAGLVNLAFRTSEQLYLNLHETDEKQTRFLVELDRRVAEMEKKLAVFEQTLRYEAQAREKAK